jgi:hypothetical protein
MQPSVSLYLCYRSAFIGGNKLLTKRLFRTSFESMCSCFTDSLAFVWLVTVVGKRTSPFIVVLQDTFRLRSHGFAGDSMQTNYVVVWLNKPANSARISPPSPSSHPQVFTTTGQVFFVAIDARSYSILMYKSESVAGLTLLKKRECSTL